ncbi:MAG: PQQ-binding-like beta-propeller repeat protein [Pirellulaceae bacterium]|nr:PQQ-binding-like beta-propeller repeat protein [Pirellulaceae bacterium]
MLPLSRTWMLLLTLWACSSSTEAAEPEQTKVGQIAWHEFRGNAHDGTALNQKPPLSWGEDKNLKWKTAIHGRGWSSPVVAEDQIWLTTATEDGKKMSAVCVSMATGKILHDLMVFENAEVQPDHHVTNSYASPTPVLDEQHVYVHFGAYGTACLERATGKTLWQRRDLPCNHYRGPGSSPILYRDLLIFHMDGFDFQYVVALNKNTGNTVWKQDRKIEYGTDNGDYYKAYSTPLIINVGGVDQMISSTSKATVVLNPLNGQEFWRVRYPEFSATARPLFDGQHLFLNTGFGKAQMLCIQVDGQGDVTDTKVLWSQKRGIGSKPSQILVQGKLFSVSDDGVVSRIDTKTGEIAWQKRIGGNFSSSLIATKDHFFAFDHDGKSYALTVADEPTVVSENSLTDGCRASPAIVDNSLIVRTITHLYRFQ